jgi:hypothetical protein
MGVGAHLGGEEESLRRKAAEWRPFPPSLPSCVASRAPLSPWISFFILCLKSALFVSLKQKKKIGEEQKEEKIAPPVCGANKVAVVFSLKKGIRRE